MLKTKLLKSYQQDIQITVIRKTLHLLFTLTFTTHDNETLSTATNPDPHFMLAKLACTRGWSHHELIIKNRNSNSAMLYFPVEPIF